MEEVTATHTEVVKEYKATDDFNNLVLDRMVKKQFGWDKLVARFNPTMEINFDASSVPPPIPLGKEWMFASPSFADTGISPNHEANAGVEGRGGGETKHIEQITEEVRGMDAEA